MKTLLTGATGFIGRELIVQGKLDYRCVVRSSSEDFSDAVVLNIESNTGWSKALDGCNTIIHLAGLAHNKAVNNEELRNVNLDGTIKLARDAAAVGIKRFVFVSSIGVNGASTRGGATFKIDSEVSPDNEYTNSKYEAELALQQIANETGMEVVIVRPTLVYGPNAPGNFGLLSRLVAKSPLLPFRCANNRRDFISVHNLADLLVCCATHEKAANKVFLASEGETVSIRQFTDSIAQGLGKRVLQMPIPVFAFRLLGKLTGKSMMIEQLFGDLEVDASTLDTALGWHPPWTMAQSMAKLDKSKF
ncbi:NAD-dependent epimerase/dehydratase family protein [Vibrio sp. D404a]|uniref:NAD-dependent epimerase/dehydratase family protein n=1 Tax=unclassified Vibrio TaxID=2614977 RepID=UPI002555E5B1|nr:MULTISPECIES: NAD-dependent epimerase/dehydratase family protein [unclassified Vibrio]MDK9737699.1 NAD-dependent epimerase/dehydratase family protein [Vibrio sp. D404a]MDK9795301.1 NAD-dependent epimerase/dehydratase family protein [Vibrio sp. D449a]